jgi:hypothetical protein
MDHQDWPGWPDDDPHFEHSEQDSGFDHSGHDPLVDDPLGPFHHDPLDYDPLGHDVDRELFGSEQAGYGDEAAHHPGAGFDSEPLAGGDHGHPDEVYPDDDPFALADHADHEAAVDDPAGQHDDSIVHDAPVEQPVGADPDLDPGTDTGWADQAFPPPLDLSDAPDPVDGFPWADPQVLGAGHTDSAVDDAGASSQSSPHIGDLYDYSGDEQPAADGWQALLASDDPATSTLARWWAPES